MTLSASAEQTAVSERTPWKLSATVHDSSNEMHDVRMASPTTYVIASRARVDGSMIEAFDATVFVDDWSLVAARLSIDLRVDAVEITTLRTEAPKE